MKTSWYLATVIVLFPYIASAGIIPDGKAIEFFGILGFASLVVILFLIYYFNWKSQKNKVHDRYVIKTTQYKKNGRFYVKSQKIKINKQPGS